MKVGGMLSRKKPSFLTSDLERIKRVYPRDGREKGPLTTRRGKWRMREKEYFVKGAALGMVIISRGKSSANRAKGGGRKTSK